MNNAYKVLDNQGRVVIPLEMRELISLNKGDIVELTLLKEGVLLSKFDIIKIGDNSKEVLRNNMIASAKQLDRKSILQVTKDLVKLAEREGDFDG